MIRTYIEDSVMRDIFIGQFYAGYTGSFYIGLYNSGNMQMGQTMNVALVTGKDDDSVYVRSFINNYTVTWNNLTGGVRKVLIYDSFTPEEPRSGVITSIDMGEDIALDDDRFLMNFSQNSIIFKGDFV